MMEDKLLIWRCQRGSRHALRQIYEKYQVDLLKRAVVLTGEANTAPDVVHDGFAKFAESVRRLALHSGSPNALLRVFGSRSPQKEMMHVIRSGTVCLPAASISMRR